MKIASCFALAVALLAADPAAAALTRVDSFGSNPGALVMYEYVPAGLPSGRPIVVVLHGCTQQAAAMENAGWNQLADLHAFTVVYPEQATANNPVRCFNWAGEYGDTANLVRGQGENQSIIQMVDKAIATHGGDPSRVYVAGFSSGAAFAAVMLATWPDRFAGGAIMSGLPYRCATTVSGAYSCQSPGVTKTAAQWGDLVRAAHAYGGTRPRVQIWHGSNDATVVPKNRDELVKQWTNVLGLDDTADETETIGQAKRTAYKTAAGAIGVEVYEVTGMGHAVAVGEAGCSGKVAAYFEDRAICSTLRAAKFFGLVGGGGGGDPDVVAPTVAIVSPADGDQVTGTVTIVVAANDDRAMGGVRLQIDGVEIGSDDAAPFQFEWDASAAGAGDHELAAIASDSAGNEATAMAVVAVPGDGGGGGGSGSGSGNEPATDLPGCSLDASAGGSGLFTIGFALALVLRTRRRGRGLRPGPP